MSTQLLPYVELEERVDRRLADLKAMPHAPPLDHRCAVVMFGQIFEYGFFEHDQVLLKNGEVFCVRPGWESGELFAFCRHIDELAGDEARSHEVLMALEHLSRTK